MLACLCGLDILYVHTRTHSDSQSWLVIGASEWFESQRHSIYSPDAGVKFVRATEVMALRLQSTAPRIE